MELELETVVSLSLLDLPNIENDPNFSVLPDGWSSTDSASATEPLPKRQKLSLSLRRARKALTDASNSKRFASPVKGTAFEEAGRGVVPKIPSTTMNGLLECFSRGCDSAM